MELDLQTLADMLPIIAAINLGVGILGWWVSGKTPTAKTVKRLSAVAIGVGGAALFAWAPAFVQQGVVAAWVATGGYAAWKRANGKTP